MAVTPGSMMDALVQDHYGDPIAVLRVDQVPVPEIRADEVLVQVAAAGVDRGTWHLVAGLPLVARAAVGVRHPKQRVPGRDVAGTVVAVGAGVTRFVPGDEVFGIGIGTVAQYAAAPEAKLVARPENLTAEHAAAVAISGITALQAVRQRARVEPGEHVLVVGASGGVGTYAVQIAKAIGARVTGVASAAKADVVGAAGADAVIDYATEDFADGRAQYDAIIDIGGGRRLADLRRALTPTGRLVIVGAETGGRWFGGLDRQLRALMVSPFVGQTLGMVFPAESGSNIAAVAELIAAGAVTPIIDRVVPLRDGAAAIQDVGDGRARGKVVVKLDATY